MSLRTPIGRARGLGSAKSGLHHWWMERITAVALIPLTLWFVVALVGLTGADHATAVAWLQTPLNAILMLLLIVATFHHMQLGLQVMIEDYIHAEGLKITMVIVEKLASFGLAVACGVAVLKVSFGG
ncbi:MAG: succinate dehydrogenase, hydrophobic membrane anchor protein [Alphaproteobacteria bacterium]|jgi:succinate dehydrogenase / fumarate reductase membrane anchor subunit|nr:succinate dehydrogenase, hydrophobic membrane anchor protein [Alphaproteobacteria bacterium]|tara:strand:- start:71 stop:451 length:381 start_codon:yes stop_codon:yes gene_type:complete